MPELKSAQEIFLSRELHHKRMVRILRVSLLAALLLLWEAASAFGWIDDFIFSSPSRMFHCCILLSEDGSLILHILTTFSETIISFLFVTAAGLFAALFLWSSRLFSEILDPYLVILNSLPKSAMAPILIVWLGNNKKSIIICAVSVAVFGCILTLYQGFSGTDPDKIKLIYSLGGKKKDVLFKVLLPSSLPLIISNMKVNIGLCLIGVIIGEFLAANMGLGYLIIYGSQVFYMDLVMVSIVILCIICAGMYKGISFLEKKVLHR